MPKKFTKERKISDAKPIIFLEGVQFTVCPIIMIPKKYPSKDRNGNSVHLGYLIKTYLYAVLFVFLLFFRQSFVSVAESVHCTDVKGKRFSGWILSVGGRFCRNGLSLDLFAFRRVGTNLMGSNGNKRLTGIKLKFQTPTITPLI